MSDAEGSGRDYSALVERIERAFADVPYPGDDRIIATPEHVAACEECGGLHEALAGRSWQELIDDEESFDHVSHAMSFYSAAGWQYYLPAYLIQTIKRGTPSSLYFRPDDDPELTEYHGRRVNRLTAEQRRAVLDYLLAAQADGRSNPYADERNREAVEHWAENCRKVAGRG